MNGGNNHGNCRGRGFGDRERSNVLNLMKKMTLNNIGMMTINIESIMHEIIQMKRDLASLNSSLLSLMVGHPKAYLTWELKVDKIFHMHNYSEEKKMAMAALEFDDYALIWWEKLLSDRENVGQ
jgi:hypothetical protein